jgi:hypothetical protein
MPKPTPGDAHVNAALTNVSIAYVLDAGRSYIADQVFPVVPVQKQSDAYFLFSQEDFLRIEAKERAPAVESAGGGYALTTATYSAKVYALHKDVDDQLRSNADPAVDPDDAAAEYITQQLLLKREKLWASAYFTTGVWTGDQTGVAAGPIANQFLQWNDAASTPIEDIRTQARVIQKRTGFYPNRLVLGPEVYDKLADHPDIIDRIKYTQQAVVTADLLAGIFGIERVLQPEALENTAAEGLAGTYSYVYNKAAQLLYAAPRPSLMVPSAGYIFAWTGFLGASAYGARMKSFRMEQNEADRIEGEMAFDPKVVAAGLGVHFASAVA